MQANRRQIFAALLAAAAARQVKGAEGTAIQGKRPMILHNDRPEDLETPVKYFDSWVTPLDAFFVRQHLPRPAAIDPAAYRLNLTGLVSKPRREPGRPAEGRTPAPATLEQRQRTSSSLRNSPASSGRGVPWEMPSGAGRA